MLVQGQSSVRRGGLLVLLSLVGCGGSGAPNSGNLPAADAGESDTGVGSVCGTPGPDVPAEATCIKQVQGRAIDAEGLPVSGLTVTVCGPICYAGESDSTGSFVVEVFKYLVLDQYSILPHGRPNHTNFYFTLPQKVSGSVIDAGELRLLPMPAEGPSLVVATDDAGAPKQTVASGPVTLEVQEGIEVKLDVEDLLNAGGKQFRALVVPGEQHRYFVSPELGLIALYALAPFESSFADAASKAEALARLSFQNDFGLAAGTRIEVLALGTYLYPEWVKPGTFEVVARATTTASTIELDVGQGLAHLTWIGLREAAE